MLGESSYEGGASGAETTSLSTSILLGRPHHPRGEIFTYMLKNKFSTYIYWTHENGKKIQKIDSSDTNKIRLLSRKLKLAIICLKDTKKGNGLILRRLRMNFPFCLFGNNFDFSF